MRYYTTFLAFLLAVPPMVLAQSAPSIEVTGAVKQELRLTAADLSAMPRATVETKSDGVTVNYQGVWLREVLNKAGVPGGTELRGKALSGYLVAEAQDGYQMR